MDYAKESLRLHGEWKGKIEVVTRVPAENKDVKSKHVRIYQLHIHRVLHSHVWRSRRM